MKSIICPLLFVSVCAAALASGAGAAASLAEAFKDINPEVRASIVKELIKSRSYDLEHTQKRPSEKGSNSGDGKAGAPDATGAVNSATGGLANARPRDGGGSSLERIKDSMDDDEYDRPMREKVCSMEIGTQKTDPGKPAPRRQTYVFTEPIIQICK